MENSDHFCPLCTWRREGWFLLLNGMYSSSSMVDNDTRGAHNFFDLANSVGEIWSLKKPSHLSNNRMNYFGKHKKSKYSHCYQYFSQKIFLYISNFPFEFQKCNETSIYKITICNLFQQNNLDIIVDENVQCT